MTGSAGTRAAAGLLATLMACLTLTPMVDGDSWVLTAGLVAAVVVGSGVGIRQVVPWPAVVVIGQATAFVISITYLFAREESLYGFLPGRAALAELNRLAVAGLEVTRAQAPPVDARPGVVLQLAIGIGLVALAVDTLAVSRRSPALAGLPLLAVYCVPAALLPRGVPWYLFLTAGAGFLVLVGADAGERVRAWGRVLSTRARGRDDTLAALGHDARRTAMTALVVAAFLPMLVPGVGERLLNGREGVGSGDGDGPTIAVVNPILRLRQDLADRSTAPVLRYTTTASSPEPIRIVTLDVFDGETWAPGTGQVPLTQQVADGMPAPPGLSTSIQAIPATTQVRVGNLAQRYLPLPYPATDIRVPGAWLYDPSTLNVIGQDTTTRGLDYEVDHLQVRPTPQQLLAAPPFRQLPPTNSTYLDLPDEMPDSIRATALEVAGRGAAYDQAVRLQRWFRGGGGFVYSTDAPGDGRNDGSVDAVSAFLAAKRGYCVQYASAMAVMARWLGIPARVAVGFLPGTDTGNGTYVVRLNDAHAWPELFFEGVGWVRFEPTPISRAGSAPGWTLPPADVLPTASATSGPAPSASASRDAGRNPRDGAADAQSQAGPTGLTGVLARIPLVIDAAGVLLVAALLAPVTAALIVRRRRWRRARDPAAQAEAAWDALRDRLGDLGIRWAVWWTPRATMTRLTTDYQLTREARLALGRLVADLEAARYAPPRLPAGRGRHALLEDVHVIAAEVAAHLPASIRRRARWFPASGVAALRRLRGQVEDEPMPRPAGRSESRQPIGSRR